MSKTIHDAFANLNLSDFPEATAVIKGNDKEISGGRSIANYKSNQLFTGQFDKVDFDAFLAIWERYKNNNRTDLKPLLMGQARAMIRNYRSEVSPIEVMLYTSNVIANSFANRKLVNEISEVVYLIFKENEEFFKSIKHILKVWKWNQAINVCEIAAGKIAAGRKSEEYKELLRYIYGEYHYMDEVNYGCFRALMESKKEEFVPDILSMVHELSGSTETDKQIANVFKKDFFTYFPSYHDGLDGNMFKDAKPFVRELIRKMIDPKRNNNMASRYKDADINEKQHLVQEALDVITKNNRTASFYDAINVLKLASNEKISKQLFEYLNLNSPFAQHSVIVKSAVIEKYFGTINYPPAIQAFEKIPSSHDYYAATRTALFLLDKISSAEIIRDFLGETKPDQVKMYLNGFFDLGSKIPSIRDSIFHYLSENLPEEKLSNAITNYYQLVQNYRQLYVPQVGEILIQNWFGFTGTVWNTVRLNLQDQMICLKMIDIFIDARNYTRYEKFLYYVAEEGLSFQASVSQLAKTILRKQNISGIRV